MKIDPTSPHTRRAVFPNAILAAIPAPLRTRTRVPAVAILLLAVAAGCGSPHRSMSGPAPASGPGPGTVVTPSSYLAKFGFEATERNRATVEASVVLANEILEGAGLDSRIQCDWKESADVDVALHLVKTHERGSLGPCFVLPGARAILVDAAEVDRIPTTFGGEDDEESDVEALLSVFLLHEVGHLDEGHNALPRFALPFSDADYNVEETDEKRKEMEADRFAGSCLRRAFEPGSAGFLSASRAQMALPKASFNLTGRSVVNSPGAPPRERYWDRSYTHPNFELRILNIWYEMSPSEGLKEMRDAFIEERQGPGTWLGVLHQDGAESESLSAYCSDGCGHLGLALTPEGLEMILEAHRQSFPEHAIEVK